MRVLSSSAPTFKPQQTESQRQEQEQLALLERVVRKFYFIHLVVIALVYSYLLIEEKNFKLCFTSVLLGIYCYMILWNWAVNFLLVVMGKDNIAVVFNRVIIRFIIMIFFPIGLSAIVAQNYLGIKLVLALLLYLCLISLLFFIYEIYGCTCGEPSNPKYIFEHNDLHAETQKVWEIRRKYNKEILSNWDENSLSLSQRQEKH